MAPQAVTDLTSMQLDVIAIGKYAQVACALGTVQQSLLFEQGKKIYGEIVAQCSRQCNNLHPGATEWLTPEALLLIVRFDGVSESRRSCP
jgi:hypothetical protein